MKKAFATLILALVLALEVGIVRPPPTETPGELKVEFKVAPSPPIEEPISPPITAPIEEPAAEEECAKLAYTIHDVVCLAKLVQGEAGGLSLLERSAVIWCALNYYDSGDWEDTIIKCVKSPNRFTGYRETNRVTDENIDLAVDVLERYRRELNGETDVGRTLPKGYICFRGFKWKERAEELGLTKAKYSHNWFFKAEDYRKEKYERNYWDWALPDPYRDGTWNLSLPQWSSSQ